MPLDSKTKDEDIVEEKEEIVAVPKPSETDQEKDMLPSPSLHKVANPYTLPIPSTCHPQKADNNKKLLKLKDPGSIMVNITLGGKKMT